MNKNGKKPDPNKPPEIDDAVWEFLKPAPAPDLTDRAIEPSSLEALLWAQCSDDEVACFFGLTLDEFIAAVENNPALDRIYKTGRTAGKAALKRMQYMAAMAGDAKLLTHLGEQHLGQTKRTEHTFTIEHIDATIAALENQLKTYQNKNVLDAESIDVEDDDS